jgi:scyllo-inositol 2-dehydrogenase (NADP+)
VGKKITVGIASFGMSGKIFHATLLFHHKNYQMKRIVERRDNEASLLYPKILLSRSIDDLLQDDEIELVIVNTPDQTHYEIAKQCLDAGKHVVVEKPFTQTVTQGKELIDLAQQKRKVLSVFQNRRWDGDYLTVQRILDEQLLGRLVDFEAHFDRYKPLIPLDTWKEKASAGAGVVYNLGSHMIDQALVLFGLPEAVTGVLKIMRADSEVDDWYDILLHYSHVNVLLKSSLLVKEPGPRYILHGTHGSFLKWGLDPQEEALKQGKNPNDKDWGRESEEWWGTLNIEKQGVTQRGKYETLPGNYSAFYDALYESIVHGKELAVKPEEALNVIRIIEAVRKSSKTRTTVVLS